MYLLYSIRHNIDFAIEQLNKYNVNLRINYLKIVKPVV